MLWFGSTGKAGFIVPVGRGEETGFGGEDDNGLKRDGNNTDEEYEHQCGRDQQK
ncbi:MAG: hypothetical protein P4L84_17470 [Isosphaeraceae bacterium]|nr:hypothetical protein [Isosphaeraceae bacterium]